MSIFRLKKTGIFKTVVTIVIKKEKRIFAISDIHGYGHLLIDLLDKSNFSIEEDRLFLLGDYVNKGPDSIGPWKLLSN